jgi:hypothetical protein
MQKHAYNTLTQKNFVVGTRTNDEELNVGASDGSPVDEYALVFRELFCIAAAELARTLNEPLENMGVLHDEIMPTGQDYHKRSRNRNLLEIISSGISSRRQHVFGRGQLLFVVRHLSSAEADVLRIKGLRFAPIHTLSDNLATSLKVDEHLLLRELNRMRNHTELAEGFAPGLHLAYFALRPAGNSFDILVRANARNRLPSLRFPLEHSVDSQLRYIQQLNGMSVYACLEYLNRMAEGSGDSDEQAFASQTADTIETLRDSIKDPNLSGAFFNANPFSIPFETPSLESSFHQAQILILSTVLHRQSRAPGPKFEFIPLSLFKAQQQVFKNSPDHGRFALRVHREFSSPVGQKKSSDAQKQAPQTSTAVYELSPLSSWDCKATQPKDTSDRLEDDDSSEHNLIQGQPVGGIMISQEVSVSVENDEVGLLRSSSGESEPPAKLGLWNDKRTLGTAMRQTDDPDNFVDLMYTACVCRS